MDEIATTQTLTHLTNISGFLREIAAELKTINRRESAKEARAAEGTGRPKPKTTRP